jgi:membrane associated rhomboid family serine protease
MQLFHPDFPPDSPAQRTADRRRWLGAFNLSLAFVLLLCAVFSAQGSFDIAPWTMRPWAGDGWRGLLTAPLLHGSFEHLAGNAFALLLLGTLVGGLYPRAGWRSLLLIWLGSGAGAWLLGAAGSHHLGASGLSHGLMFLLLTLGLLRRDRAAIAAAMIAFLLYGGMLMTVLPREVGVSWQSHLGGAVGGVLAALLWRRRDPLPPRKRYDWEDEEEPGGTAADPQLEPPRPDSVPVVWRRPEGSPGRGMVLRFPPRK